MGVLSAYRPHGYAHEMITQQSPERFASDLRQSLRVLRSQSGQRVVGYRAPSFSVVRDTLWALDILIDHGIEYDRRARQQRRDRFGVFRGAEHAELHGGDFHLCEQRLTCSIAAANPVT